MNILIIGYKRFTAIERLLQRLCDYKIIPNKIFLCVDGPIAYEELHSKFSKFQSKLNIEFIAQERNLGLREHVLFACDKASNFGDFIVLEEDCDVSKSFMSYAVSAIDYYRDDKNIAGVSLYKYSNIEISNRSFISLSDKSDVFFMKVPSSSGQCWTQKQWQDFRNWLEKNKNNLNELFGDIPYEASRWNDSSWKKLFWAYMVSSNKYFVFPQISLSTNVSDDGGSNISNNTTIHQTPLLLSNSFNFNFIKFNNSDCIYDQFFELERLKDPSLYGLAKNISVGINLQGLLRNPENYDYILSYFGKDPIMSFGLSYKPVEQNIFMNCKGSIITISKYDGINYQNYEYSSGIKFHNKNFFSWFVIEFFKKVKKNL